MDLLNTIQGRIPLWVVSFVTTVMSSLIWPALPSPIILPLLCVVALFVIKFPAGIYLSGGLFGVVWMASVGHWQVNWQLPTHEIRQIQQVTGSIESVIYGTGPVRFNLRLDKINGKSLLTSPLVRLSWRQPIQNIKQGQRLQLGVKLKPIHGLANEGGFRYQQWLIANRINATGYVIDNGKSMVLDKKHSLRQRLIDNINAMGLKQSHWIIALSLGERGQFTQQDWRLLQETGTAHLMAISGLHLSIVASLCYLVVSFFFYSFSRALVIPQWINYQALIVGIVIICTMLYATLAGFSLPTLRAWLMLVMWAVLSSFNRHIRPFYFLLYCIFIFILIAPLSVLSMSFWLSFSAVCAIALINWRWLKMPDMTDNIGLKACFIVKQMIVLQIALSILLSPIVAAFFSIFVPSSSVINLLAIPLVTLILVPVCLIGTVLLLFSIKASYSVFSFADLILEYSVNALKQSLDWLPSVIELPGASSVAWLWVIVWLFVVILPVDIKQKIFGLVLLLPLVTYFSPQRSQLWHMHVLDVGNGLSIVLERSGRALVYDVGSAFKSGYNMGQSALLPFLKHRGINRIDKLFISHMDNDHAGSLPYVLNNFDVKSVVTNRDGCNSSLAIEWRGLQIKGLWPHPNSGAAGNDGSCVLHISDGKHSVLLPGDISSEVEHQLIIEHGNFLDSDVLVAAHHGSSTSSAKTFVNEVNPAHTIFSHGQHARWGFPAQEVVSRFVDIGSRMHSTSESGQVSVTFNVEHESNPKINASTESDSSIVVRRYREHVLPVWYNKILDITE